MNSDRRETGWQSGTLGLMAAGVGVAVLLGWVFDIGWLKSILPGVVTMKVNTAIGFVLAGISLALLAGAAESVWARRLSRMLAGVTALLGLLTLCQYLSGLDWGIDQILFREAPGAVGTLAPNRMAPVTAINFLLMGCAFVLASFPRTVLAAQCVVLVTGVMGLLPLLGYVYGATALVGVGRYTQMAVHTAALFVLLSLGALLARPSEGFMRTVTGDTVGGWLLRRAVPLVVGVPVILGWLRVKGEQHACFNGPLGVALMMTTLMLILTALIWWAARTLNRADAERRRADDAMREHQLQLRQFVEHSPAAIAMFDRDMRYILTSRRWLADYRIEGPVIGRSHYEVFPELPERLKEIHRRCLAGATQKGDDDPFPRADGTTDWIRWEARPWHTSRGEIGGIIILSEIITERKNAERAFHEVHDLLNEVGRIAKIGGWRMDLATGKATWTLGTYDIVEIAPGEPIPGVSEHVGYYLPEYRAQVAEAMRALIEDDKPLEFEAESRTVKGNIKFCRAVGRCVRVNGKVIEIYGTLQDITERKKAEAALRASDARYRSLFENMVEGFAYCRMIFEDDRPRDFFYIAVNEAFETLTGLKNVVGRKVSEVIPGIIESDPELIERYGRVARTGKPERFETYVAALDMWFSVSVYSPARDHFVAVFDVITARKRAEMALRDAETRYRLLFEHSPEGVVILDPVTARAIEFNEMAHTQLGYTREEFARLSLAEIDASETPGETRARIASVMREGRKDFETLHRTKTGEVRNVFVTAQASEIAGRTVYHCLWRDITDQKQSEARRHELEAQLQHAQKMESVGRLAGGVAHDFNNILTGIGGYTELATDRLDEKHPARDDLAEVQRLAKRAADLTRQLLAFSRRQPLEPMVLNLNETVAYTAKMLKRVLGENIDLQFIHGASLGNVRADPGQVEQILMNLAVNARDAMPEGGKLTIETANVDLDAGYASHHVAVAPGRYVMVAVSDTGHGMDSATQARLFEPFFTTKEKGKGTGLGLATVYGIVKQHGGSIWVYSEPGKGATFKIYLPCVADAVTSVASPPLSQTAQGHETILLVEDEAAVRGFAERTLSARGYSVLGAADAEEALRLFKGHPGCISLLLTDVVLPGMNGRKLYDRLKAVDPQLKVIYTSGYTDNAIVHQGVLDAGTIFIQKPFTADALARKVRQVLDT